MKPAPAYLLGRMYTPGFPEVVGVLWTVRKPAYEERLDGQINAVMAKKGRGKIQALFQAEDAWAVV